MKKIFAFAAFAAALVATVSCNKEQNVAPVPTMTKTLSLGLEDRIPSNDTKTYVKDVTTGAIWWGDHDLDRVVYVFDANCTKYPFVSTSTTPEATREFSCDTWPVDAEPGFVVWSGRYISGTNTQNDQTVVDGDIISGLVLPTTQYYDHRSSYAYNTNVAVMKPGDTALRNVFGYIRYTIPETEGYAAIKSVKIEADELLAGNVQIDYSGDEPVATILSGGQKQITADTNFNGGYEAGTYYLTVPAGTFHNFKITITPFAENADRSQKSAMAAAPFTLSAKADVVVERGKYTDAGELIYVDPNEEEEDEDIEWPTDTDAFDYGYTKGVTHTASYPKAERLAQGFPESGDYTLSAGNNATLDKITYFGPLTYCGDRFRTGQKMGPDVWMDLDGTEYDNFVPQNRCFSWKVNRPGKFKYFCSVTQDKFISRGIYYTLVLVKSVSGETTYHRLYDFRPEDSKFTTGKPSAYPDSYIEFEVTKDDLLGIDEAATLYFYAHTSDTGGITVQHYPILWTPTATEKLNN